MVILLLGCAVQDSIALPDGEVGVDPGDTHTAELIGDSATPDSGSTLSEPEPYVPGTPDVIVDCAGAGDFTTISAAVSASHSGTKIGLAPCTYQELVNYSGKSLDIFGLEGAETTIIDGDGDGPIVTAARGEGPGTRLAGVTLTGGRSEYASAVYVDTAMLSLEHVVLSGNQDAYAVIYGSGAGIDLTDVRMEGNDVSRQGAPIMTDNGYMRAERFYLACNGDTYGIYQHNVTLLLDSEISCPQAEYAVVVDSGELHSRGSRIEGGQIGIYGADNPDTLNERLWLYNTAVVAEGTAATVAYMHVKVQNSVLFGVEAGLTMTDCHVESFAYDSAFIGGTCPLRGDSTPFAAGWNAYGEGEGCRVDSFESVTGDPGFRDAPDDFRLSAGSPLVDAGNPEDEHQDADGSRGDIGVYGGPAGGGEAE